MTLALPRVDSCLKIFRLIGLEQRRVKQLHRDLDPALTDAVSSGKTINPLACTIDFRMPEPCSPVETTRYRPSSMVTRARMKWRVPFFFSMSSVSRARMVLRKSILVSHHLQDGRPDELLKGNHGRNGIAGKPEQRNAVHGAEGQWLTGSHGDLPELHAVAHLLHDVLDQVVIAHGDAARGNDQIGPQGGLEFGHQILPRIFRDSDLQRDRAAIQDLRGQGVAVGADDLPGGWILVHIDQFIAGGENRNQRLLVNGNKRTSQSRQHADLRRPDDTRRER